MPLGEQGKIGEPPVSDQMHHDVLAADRFRRSRGLWRLLALLAAIIAILALVGRFALPQFAAGERLMR